jgi:hypothetical protein
MTIVGNPVCASGNDNDAHGDRAAGLVPIKIDLAAIALPKR